MISIILNSLLLFHKLYNKTLDLNCIALTSLTYLFFKIKYGASFYYYIIENWENIKRK